MQWNGRIVLRMRAAACRPSRRKHPSDYLNLNRVVFLGMSKHVSILCLGTCWQGGVTAGSRTLLALGYPQNRICKSRIFFKQDRQKGEKRVWTCHVRYCNCHMVYSLLRSIWNPHIPRIRATGRPSSFAAVLCEQVFQLLWIRLVRKAELFCVIDLHWSYIWLSILSADLQRLCDSRSWELASSCLPFSMSMLKASCLLTQGVCINCLTVSALLNSFFTVSAFLSNRDTHSLWSHPEGVATELKNSSWKFRSENGGQRQQKWQQQQQWQRYYV